MHYVAVALDKHQLVDLHAAEAAHAAHIVAAQVDQHHVFGALFFIAHHFVGERVVFRFTCAAAACAGDGPVLDLALVHADQKLRRRTRKFEGLRPF